MLQATMTAGKRKIILLGLEEGNIDRLRKGHPIHVTGDPMGFAGDIMIILGKDSEDLKRQLESLITEDTITHDNRSLARQ
jgi:hypothetical protein